MNILLCLCMHPSRDKSAGVCLLSLEPDSLGFDNSTLVCFEIRSIYFGILFMNSFLIVGIFKSWCNLSLVMYHGESVIILRSVG